MHSLTVPDIAVSEVETDDLRVGHLLSTGLEEGETPEVVILGFPSDRGVEINGGRKGAAEAPDEIRKALYAMTPGTDTGEHFSRLLSKSRDLGNVQVTGEVSRDQELLGTILADVIGENSIPIILGGGHETAFGHFLGYAKSDLKTAIINLDAHSDVRPLKNGRAHSGSPFRQAYEHDSGCCRQYLVAGLQPHSTAKAHLEYIGKQGGRYLLKDETNITSFSGLLHEPECMQLLVTFDMDAVDRAFAPGVSAPCSNGLSSELWLTAAYLAGRHEKVSSFDVCEVNPAYDHDGQTSRMAALTIWHFLHGLSERKGG